MPPGTMIVVPRWDQAADGSIGPEEKPDDIVVMGRSLGSGVATMLAAERPALTDQPTARATLRSPCLQQPR